ncbi:tRNA (adenosine(37)-N6)-dimethylallyltransferase MiaA [Ferroacidibacillus organovorans]|uniref:tRNA dimethylallyltransferase n=1 Tax=Ferroacidibacillus organovorans TaxID=1765683 RepID=A0A1V4ERX5_9BACL|nr:tRNA (adenosine(37)-N6)-dimethylallyltransferase MiaA [Ferroacidibacillus organovorans]OPG15600.1 tRNA (adenosine(37)-N6)-dimethylallyltransferase MiaA [Ferroacidibacillus organovorans]
MKTRILCIVGPTAVGKTELSLQLAEALSGEIVSADSMQVYRGMDIGTAKLLMNQRRGIVHHMIDVADPTEVYTVHRYAVQARKTIDEIALRGKTPIVVGGTGLYVRALTEHFDFTETRENEAFRAQLTARAEREGVQRLHEELMLRDPEAATRIHPNDLRRIIRALEVNEITGKTLHENWNQGDSPYDSVMIGLTLSRDALYQRIDARVLQMMEEGLLDEVERLRARGCRRDMASMQAIGYRQVFDFFEGLISREAMIDEIKKASRRYAKRQWSWYRNDQSVHWYDRSEDGMILEMIRDRVLQGWFESRSGSQPLGGTR